MTIICVSYGVTCMQPHKARHTKVKLSSNN